MNITRNTVLITGGGSGIGLALARRLLDNNNRVIICGRDAERLNKVKQSFSDLAIFPCDITKADDREQLARKIREFYPELNILVNNAAIHSPGFNQGAIQFQRDRHPDRNKFYGSCKTCRIVLSTSGG